MEFKALEKVGLDQIMSPFGQRIFLPQGIFYWSGRAKKEADINATIGTAKAKKGAIYGDGDETTVTCHLPSIIKHFTELGPEDVFPYSPIPGHPAFREAWKKYLLSKAGEKASEIENNIGTPIVTSGITGGLYVAVKMFAAEGEKVVCPEKRWGNYDNVVVKNIGASFHSFVFFKDGKFNTEGFIQALNEVWEEQDKAVVTLNFPNNPTGYMPTQAEIDEVREELLKAVEATGKKAILLFDDAYEGYVYDDAAMKQSPFYDFVNIDDRIIPVKMDGISKELLWYGGRIGALTFGYPDGWLSEVKLEELQAEVDNKFSGAIRSTDSNYNLATQRIVTQALADIPAMVKERQRTIDVLKQRYDVWVEETAKWDKSVLYTDPAQAGFFAFVNVVGPAADKVAETLLVKYKVGTVPQVKPAEDINGIRVAFCSVEASDIPALCEKLVQAVKDES